MRAFVFAVLLASGAAAQWAALPVPFFRGCADGVLALEGDGYVVTTLGYRTGDMTVSVWLRSRAPAVYQTAVCTAENFPYGLQGVLFYESAPRIDGAVGDGTPWKSNHAVSVKALEKDVWYHVVLVHAANDCDRLYVDGALDGASPETASGTGGSDGTYVFGAFGAGDWLWNGYLDDVAVWDRAFSAGEVAVLTGCRGRAIARAFPSGLAELFTFDDGPSVAGVNGSVGSRVGNARIIASGEVSVIEQGEGP